MHDVGLLVSPNVAPLRAGRTERLRILAMGLTDCRNMPVSTANHEALDRYEEAEDLFLSYFADPLVVIGDALADDPTFVMGHCFRAGLMLVSSEGSAATELEKSVKAGESLWDDANDRERGHIVAARAWLDGDFASAIRLYGDLLRDYPRDTLALQVAHIGDFLLGQQTMLRDRVARVLPHWDETVPGYSYLLGMRAFGLEETNDFVAAESAGRRALDINPKDPWAIHAVAHVMEMQGRLADGVAWLDHRAENWAPENMFAYHNWWHLALFHLDLGETDRVLELYDTRIHPEPTSVAMELLDASSLLWRLQLRGVDVGDRWQGLADSWGEILEAGYYGFNDFHAMMTFVAAGRADAADDLLAKLAECAAGERTAAMINREVALPLCRALQAFSKGDYSECVNLIEATRPRAVLFGGSNAQRDVIGLTQVEASLRGGMRSTARSLAAERTHYKPSNPFNWQLTARVFELAGDEHGAEQMRSQASALVSQSLCSHPTAAA